MKISKEVIIISIAILSVIVNVYLGYKLISVHDNTEKYSRIQAQNDSLINSNISHVTIIGNNDRREADSLIDIVNSYKKADSLNKVKYNYEKNKVKSYSPKQLHSAYDSIYGPTQ